MADWKVTRRDFLKTSGLALAGLYSSAVFAKDAVVGDAKNLRFGIVSDAHYADRPASGTRYYRESKDKMTECVSLMNDQQVDFLIHLGDFKDQGNPASEKETLQFLKTIESVFGQFKGSRYHVLGNHDMDSLSKEQFLAGVENTGIDPASSYYYFDTQGCRFLVLDANYSSDGTDYNHGKFNWTDANIPPQELQWLEATLASTTSPVIVFCHQQLDGDGPHTVRNAAEVRKILQSSNKVVAAFHGHNHAGHCSQVEGIHYYTLPAMVEGTGPKNNAYAIVEAQPDHSLVVTGYRKAVSKDLPEICVNK